MTNDTDTKQRLAAWLEPYVVDLTEPVLAARAAAVNDLAADLTGTTVLRMVAAAHGSELADVDRDWLAEVARAHDDTFVAQGRDGLLGVLAAAAVWVGLNKPASPRRAALGYAVECAAFCGLVPKIDGLQSEADRALHDTAIAVRRRTALPTNAKAMVASTMEKAAAEEGTDEAVAAINALAKHVDTAFTTLRTRQALIDEELDLLWWSAQGSNSRGVAWATMKPAVRALNAAKELQAKSGSYVLPPAGPALLDTALKQAAKTEMSIADFVKAAPDASVPASRFTLLPITACRSVIGDVGVADDTWKALVTRTIGVDLTTMHSLHAIAQQVARELVIMANLDLA
jgi:hypothetical protein